MDCGADSNRNDKAMPIIRAEIIQAAAIKCRYCRHLSRGSEGVATPAPQPSQIVTCPLCASILDATTLVAGRIHARSATAFLTQNTEDGAAIIAHESRSPTAHVPGQPDGSNQHDHVYQQIRRSDSQRRSAHHTEPTICFTKRRLAVLAFTLPIYPRKYPRGLGGTDGPCPWLRSLELSVIHLEANCLIRSKRCLTPGISGISTQTQYLNRFVRFQSPPFLTAAFSGFALVLSQSVMGMTLNPTRWANVIILIGTPSRTK